LRTLFSSGVSFFFLALFVFVFVVASISVLFLSCRSEARPLRVRTLFIIVVTKWGVEPHLV
jgi:hypothetical protein